MKQKDTDDGFIVWLKRCVDFGMIDLYTYYQEYGNHEGYPKCCIDNFVKLDKEGHYPYNFMTSLYGKDHDCTWYVRCLRCRITGKVVHKGRISRK